MNRFQATVARWAGVDPEEIVEQQTTLDEVLKVAEEAVSQYTLLERQLDELRYVDIYEGQAKQGQIITDDKRLAVLTRIRRLRHENPIAKRAINLHLYFVLGQGISHTVPDKQDRDNFNAFWEDEENQQVFTGHKAMSQRLDDVRTDGEDFIALFVAQAAPFVKLATVPLEEIKQILYHPANREVPVWYKRVWFEQEYDPEANDGEGAWKALPDKPKVKYYRDWRINDERLADIETRGLKIPESRQAVDDDGRPIYMKHRYVNEARMKSGVRGMSDLFASRDWIYGHKDFTEGRLAINAAAAAIAIHRKVKGGPARVSALRNSLGGLKLTPDAGSQDALNPSKYTRPAYGSILTTTEAEDLKGIKIDTGAPNAALDRDGVVASIAAGVGHPSHYLVGSSNAILAGVQSIEIATMKGYEDAQQWAKTDLMELSKFVFRQIDGKSSDVVTSSDDDEAAQPERIVFSFPPIEGKDIVKHITANAQFAQQIAPKNRAARKVAIKNALIALKVPDVETVMKEIEADEARLATVEDQNLALQQEQMKNGGLPGAGEPPKNGKANGKDNGFGKGNGQKATTGPQAQGSGPDDARAAKLKAPRETTTGPRSNRQ